MPQRLQELMANLSFQRTPSAPLKSNLEHQLLRLRSGSVWPKRDYGAWLSCPVVEAPRVFTQWTGELKAFPAPLPLRAQNKQ